MVVHRQKTVKSVKCLLYFLSAGGKGQPICKKFYLATLGITQDVVFGAIRKLTDTGAVIADMRGTHKNHPTLDENIVQDIRDHIKSLSSVPSHYCRKSSSKQYLQDELSLVAMYHLYKEHFATRWAHPVLKKLYIQSCILQGL